MSDYFPQEILILILQRLPPKSLIKCTSVSKSWHSLITHPSFISSTITTNINPPSLLLQFCNELSHPINVSYSLRRDHHPSLPESSSSPLLLPSAFHRELSVIAISNGVLCLTTGQLCLDLIICNPCVRRYVTLPKPHDHASLYLASVGFAFDFKNNDFKVVRICSMLDDARFGLCVPEVEVCSLETGFWRKCSSPAPVCNLSYVGSYAPHGFVNGVIHWGAKRRVANYNDNCWYHFVLSFDFEDEVFGEVLLPRSLASVSSDSVTVIGGGGGKSLTVYHVSDGSPCTCNIWVMKEYGVVESWSKLFTFNLMGFSLEAPSLGIMVSGVTAPPAPLCVRNSGEVLLLMDEAGNGCLYSVDMEGKRFIDLQIGGKGYTWYLYSGYYTESLVFLNKSSGMVSY
ncbi:hypothetical protein RIF29_21173 [Crotalaria pallida]|uniref:F-box domain-containing protein n=1 Tax=Crotalaria pallida TaxID=3830 RepID=A0AAN9F497_CROPI